MTTAILASNTLNAHPLFVALMNSTDFESISTLLGGTLGDERKAFLATTDSNGDTALIKAVKAAPWKVASGLMTIGADVNATNREGRTALRLAVKCPRCDSLDTVEIARFGSTSCKALYECRACLEPFDFFKVL